MRMRVDEAGHGRPPLRIKFGIGRIAMADACNQAVDDGDVRQFELAGRQMEDIRVFDDQIGLHAFQCYGNTCFHAT